MTDKYCPLRFREYDSNPHDQRCIGEYCAWFDKCSQSHGEPIYGSVCDATNGIDGETNGIADDSPLVDEPPEGDAVAILRKYANFWNLSHETHTQCDSDWEVTTMMALADMVERDYVSRQDFDAQHRTLCAVREQRDRESEANRSHVRVIAKLEAERDELQAKVDELESLDDGLLDKYLERGEKIAELQAQVDELTADLTHFERFKNKVIPDLRAERDQWRDAAGTVHDMWEQAVTERDEWKAKVDELEKRLAGNARHPFSETILASLDSRENELKLQEKVDELARENAKLSSDELHWRSEAKRLEGELKTQRNNFDQATGARDYWKEKLGILLKRLSDMGCKVGSINDVPIEVELPREDEGLA